MKTEAETSLSGYARSRHLLVLVVICVVGAAVYLPSFSVPFHYDDLAEIVGNRALSDLSDWSTIFEYNPARALLMFTFALDLHFWGLNTFPYHLENLIIHILNTFLVYLLAERLLGRLGERPQRRPGALEAPSGWSPALAVALIFAVHPLFVEAVTYIASRSSSLTALFYLLSFGAYVRFRDVQSGERSHVGAGVWLFLSVNIYFLAIFTKEEGVSLPAIVLAYDLLLAPRRKKDGIASNPSWWLGSLPFWLAFGLVVGGRLRLYGTLMPPVEIRSIGDNLLSELGATIEYLRLMVFPSGLNIYHDYQTVSSFWQSGTVLAALFHAVLLFIAFWNRSRRPLVSFGILWFYITLSPTSSVIPLKEIMAEHRMYLAGFGILLIVGGGLLWLRERFRVPSWVVGALISVPLAVAAFQYNRLWQSDIALWKHAVALSPHSGDAYYALGDAFARARDFSKAEEAYKRSIRNYEDLGVNRSKYKYSYVDALNNLGLVYGQQGKLDLAISHFRRALQVNPEYTQGWNNLGYAQLQKGLYFEASMAFEEAVRIAPDESWLGHYHLGNIYYDRLPDRERAAFHYRRALEINPDLPDAVTVKQRLAELRL